MCRWRSFDRRCSKWTLLGPRFCGRCNDGISLVWRLWRHGQLCSQLADLHRGRSRGDGSPVGLLHLTRHREGHRRVTRRCRLLKVCRIGELRRQGTHACGPWLVEGQCNHTRPGRLRLGIRLVQDGLGHLPTLCLLRLWLWLLRTWRRLTHRVGCSGGGWIRQGKDVKPKLAAGRTTGVLAVVQKLLC